MLPLPLLYSIHAITLFCAAAIAQAVSSEEVD
jgi:hypothetical protein